MLWSETEASSYGGRTHFRRRAAAAAVTGPSPAGQLTAPNAYAGGLVGSVRQHTAQLRPVRPSVQLSMPPPCPGGATHTTRHGHTHTHTHRQLLATQPFPLLDASRHLLHFSLFAASPSCPRDRISPNKPLATAQRRIRDARTRSSSPSPKALL